LIIRRRRKQSTQNGYLTQRIINGEAFWIGNYCEYPRDPETGETKKLHRTITEPLGLVSKMSQDTAKKKCARQVRQKLSTGITRHDRRVNFKWFADNEYIKSESPRWSASTTATKTGDLKNYIYPFLGKLSLEEITLQVLKDRFLNKLGEDGANYSEDTIKRAKTLVSTILDYAVEREYLIGNPAASRRYKLPRCKPRDRQTATMEDIGRVVNAIRDDRDLVVMKLAQAGAGPAEIFSIELGAVHLDDTTLELTMDDYIEIRNSAYRGRLIRGRTKVDARARKAWVDSVRMKASLLSLMQKAKDKRFDDLLFPSRIHGQVIWSGIYLAKRIRPVVKQLGIRVPINFRVLRRSFMTWTEDSRADRLETIQSVVGHTPGSDVTKRRYIQHKDAKAAALVREYAALCDMEAKNFEVKHQRTKITCEQLKAYQLAEYAEISRRIQ
jgi:integrase